MVTEQDIATEKIKYYGNKKMSIKDIIKIEIDEWDKSGKPEAMIKGHNYYTGEKMAIDDKKRTAVGKGGRVIEDRHLSNKKLKYPFLRKLTDQKVAYLLTNEMKTQTDNEQYKELLDERYNQSFHKTLKNSAADAITKGIAWLQVYYDDGQLKLKRHKSEQIIPLWTDEIHDKLDAIIRKYKVTEYNGTEPTEVTKIEYWDKEGAYFFREEDGEIIEDVEKVSGGHIRTSKTDENGEVVGIGHASWGKVPWIYFKYNDLEQPLVELIDTLVDDYMKMYSLLSDTGEDMPNSGFVLKEYDGADLGEFREKWAMFRTVKTSGDGGVDTISVDVDIEIFKEHLKQLRQDIYEFGRGVDTKSEKMTGNPSGVALEMLYNDLDMDCSILETEIQASLEYLQYFIDIDILEQTGLDFTEDTVEYVFSRKAITNDLDTVKVCKESKGIISDKTIISNHPWSSDNELDLVKQQEKENMERYAGYWEEEDGLGEGDGDEE